MQSARDAVSRGSSLLDMKRPGWYREINIAQLNIMRPTDCICGQLFGGYGEGVNELGVGSRAGEYGFNALGPSAFEELNEAWREEIARRRLAQIPQPVAV